MTVFLNRCSLLRITVKNIGWWNGSQIADEQVETKHIVIVAHEVKINFTFITLFLELIGFFGYVILKTYGNPVI